MKVVPQDPKSYGEFYTGDSYIILHVRILAYYIFNIYFLEISLLPFTVMTPFEKKIAVMALDLLLSNMPDFYTCFHKSINCRCF